MQGESVPAIAIAEQPQNPQEEQRPAYDFTECTRIKKLTTHDIYRLKHQNQPLIVKLFSPEALPNYQQEVSCLTRIDNDHILRILYHRTAQNPISCQPLQRNHMIVLRQATRGDLNDYLPKFGRMTEKMARTYFRQLVSGLSAAAKHKPPVIHPNLQASSILLNQSGQLYICGWSQIATKDDQTRVEELVFSCGEILICMLTSFMPFYKKYSSTDAFFKFITQDHIHKFWHQLQKRMMRVDKKFNFSPQLKNLIENIFLKKISNFQEVEKQQWVQGETYSPQEMLKLLEDNQKEKLEKMAVRRKQEIAGEQNRKKVLMEFQLSYGLERSSPEEEQFINDYQQNIIKEKELPQGIRNLRVQGSPGFVVACLKGFLREQNGKESVLVGQQFILSNYKVVKTNNYIIIDLMFSVSLLQQEDQGLIQIPDPTDTVSLKLKLSFYRSNKQVYAQIEALQSNFNSYYTTLAMHFLEQKINRKRQVSSLIKSQQM